MQPGKSEKKMWSKTNLQAQLLRSLTKIIDSQLAALWRKTWRKHVLTRSEDPARSNTCTQACCSEGRTTRHKHVKQHYSQLPTMFNVVRNLANYRRRSNTNDVTFSTQKWQHWWGRFWRKHVLPRFGTPVESRKYTQTCWFDGRTTRQKHVVRNSTNYKRRSNTNDVTFSTQKWQRWWGRLSRKQALPRFGIL